MKIILAAVEEDLADAWERHCGDLPDVSVYRGSILDLSVDAVVSPANSFGFMDGGIDHRYYHHFGWDVQDRLQALIRTRHHGELLVGAAEIIETGNLRIPFVIAAPTMRVPMVLTDTVNPFLAARAVLLLVKHGVVPAGPLAGEPVAAAVQSVAFPGLGTGVGRVGPNTCAHQVRAAIEEVVLGRGEFPRTWAEAQQWHQLLYTDRVRDLQRGLSVMRQLVGLRCTLCQKRIGSVLDGGFCPGCGCPVHNQCVGKEPRAPENCRTCGSPGADVAEQQHKELQEAVAIQKAMQADWGSRLIGSGIFTLAGGVAASFFCLGFVVLTGAIVVGVAQIITGVVVLIRTGASGTGAKPPDPPRS